LFDVARAAPGCATREIGAQGDGAHQLVAKRLIDRTRSTGSREAKLMR